MQQQADEARLRLRDARIKLEHTKVFLRDTAAVLEEVAAILRTDPARYFGPLKSLSLIDGQTISCDRHPRANAALDHTAIKAVIADHLLAQDEVKTATLEALRLGIV